MPLIAVAYVAVAVGLLLGFGGFVVPAILAALATGAILLWHRHGVMALLAALLAVGGVLGATLAWDDARCRVRITRDGGATVRLDEDAGPQRTARGVTVMPRCAVRVRVRTRGTRAPLGAVVRVVGEARAVGDMVTFAGARLRMLAAPGSVSRWRRAAGTLIDSLYGAQSTLARALLIADAHDVDAAIRRQFADAGIVHMLAVSGLHVAVLAEAVVLLAMLGGAGVRRAEAVAVVVTGLFVLFVGAPASAVRACTMYAALVAARRLQRPTSPWALLALGGLLPLVHPRGVGDVGYQLSVAGISAIFAAGALVRRLPLEGVAPWLGRLVAEFVMSSVAAAVTAPVVAWHFGRVSLAAPLTNLAAAPLFGLAQPTLFLSLLCAPVPPLARFVADAGRVLLAAIAKVAAAGASLPGAAIDVMPGAVTALLLVAASVSLVVLCASRHWQRPAIAGIGALAAAVWWPLVPLPAGALEVHVIDVGQGDAIALRTPHGDWVLMDAGDAWRTGDAGARVVVPYVRRRGGRVAALLLSHPHTDHVGGAASVIRMLSVAGVYDGGFVHTSEAYHATLEAARARHVPWHLARAGDSLTVDGVRLVFLAPDSAIVAHAVEANEASVVVLVRFRGEQVLLTGDAERDEEDWLRAHAGVRLRSDVLKVGHHGSRTSSSPAFLDAVRPRIALVSVGAGNRYGHPSPEIMEAFRTRGVQLLRTDDDGSIVVSIDGRSLRIRTDDGAWVLRSRGTGAPSGPP